MEHKTEPTPTAGRERLLGCPYCGQPPRILFNNCGYESEHSWRIECLSEWCIAAPLMEHKDKQTAISGWNTRAFPALSPDNAGLREEVARIITDIVIVGGSPGAIADAALAVVRKHVGGA